MNRKMKSLVGAIGTGAAISAAVMATSPAPALAAGCNTTWNVSIRGGQSHYSVDCFGATYRVSGWVKDTKPDGKCAQVRAVFGSGVKWSSRACPNGTRRDFSFSGTGGVNVYTFVG
jgi:hypothetical protein